MEIVALQIDLARQKENVSFLKKMADFAVENGYNTVFLYLENAVRTEDTAFFDEAETYSLQEMAEIVEYMEGKGLDVVPAFENLYHMEKFFRYPQLARFSEFEDERAEGRGWSPEKYRRGSTGCVSDPEFIAFIDKYVRDVCTVFHSRYVHMGLDEIFEFAECGRCKKVLAAGTTKEELFYRHVMHSRELIRSLGREMMMWDDFFEYFDIVSRLPRDIVFCCWHYGFVADEPKGHWTNRIKRDWLRIYDSLGFRYLFCCYANNASSVFNADTFTAYALKFRPLGALMTTWEKSDRAYNGMFPCIAYTGRLWSHGSFSEEEKISLYEHFLGDRDLAKALLALALPNFPAGYDDVAKVAECNHHAKYMLKNQIGLLLPALREARMRSEGERGKIVTDIYDCVYERYLYLSLQELGNEIFDAYECPSRPRTGIIGKLEQIGRGFGEIREDARRLWAEEREGIQSFCGAFDEHYDGNVSAVERVKTAFAAAGEPGILYLDLMLHDCYGTGKLEICVGYTGGGEEVVWKGALKPSVVMFDDGGCTSFRFAVRNERIKYVVLNAYGEGPVYPMNVHCMTGGEKYYAVGAERLYGRVRNAKNLLFPDTRFAETGYDCGLDHLNDGNLWKKKSGVRIRF